MANVELDLVLCPACRGNISMYKKIVISKDKINNGQKLGAETYVCTNKGCLLMVDMDKQKTWQFIELRKKEPKRYASIDTTKDN